MVNVFTLHKFTFIIVGWGGLVIYLYLEIIFLISNVFFKIFRFVLADVEKEAPLFVEDLLNECGVDFETQVSKGIESKRKNTSMKLLMVALNVLT